MPERPRVSAFVVCRNEADKIGPCLESLAWVDELLVVDSFSTDDTVEIARKHTDRVVQREWPGYREQKSWALEQLGHDWVLYLDADERVSDALRAEIEAALAAAPDSTTAFRMPRKSFYLGRWIEHGGWYPDYCTRLFRKSRGRMVGLNPHEYWETDGTVGTLRADLVHYTYRNLGDQIRTVDRFSDSSAAELLRAGRTGGLFWRMLLRPPAKFLIGYLWKGGFRDGLPGFVIAVNSAFYVFNRYAKLWEWSRLGRDDFPEDFPYVPPPRADE